jgi:hypothetical protein
MSDIPFPAFIVALLCGLLAWLVAPNFGAGQNAVLWDVCDGHGEVTKIVNSADNRTATIDCEDGFRYRLTLTVLGR